MQLQQLTQEQANHLLPGQGDMQDALRGLSSGGTEVETVSAAGAISVSIPTTHLSVTGTVAYTLADGTFAGQRKTILCTVAATSPLGTVTIASPETLAGYVVSATHVFDTVSQGLELIWSGTKWRCLRTRRAGAMVPVIGTTVLTGFTLTANYATSVTATVSSTGNKSIPDGQYPGDTCVVGCSVAASTPIGNINFSGVDTANVARTDLQAIGALADTVTLVWNGLKWLVVANVGITVA